MTGNGQNSKHLSLVMTLNCRENKLVVVVDLGIQFKMIKNNY